MPPSAPIDPRQSMKAQLAYTLRALRTVKGLSQDQLAKELLSGDVREGDTVRVDLDPAAAGGTGGLIVGRALPVSIS